MASALKDQGYATGQFGRTIRRPRRVPADRPRLRRVLRQPLPPERRGEEPRTATTRRTRPSARQFGPRGVIHRRQSRRPHRDTGPLTRKRMETVDDETPAAAIDLNRQADAKTPVLRLDEHDADARPHPRPRRAPSPGPDGPDRVRRRHGRDRRRHRDDPRRPRQEGPDRQHHRHLHDRQRPAPEHLADAGTTPFRSEKNTNWEGAYRVPGAGPLAPGHIQPGTWFNGIVSGARLVPDAPRPPAIRDITKQLLDGTTIQGKQG